MRLAGRLGACHAAIVRTVLALLPRLIVAVLLLQTVMAPAHCLAHAAAAGFATEICSPDGTRILHLNADGDVVPDGTATQGFCAACHGLPSTPHLATPVLPTPAWTVAAVFWHAASADSLPPSARAPPFEPTGPPSAS